MTERTDPPASTFANTHVAVALVTVATVALGVIGMMLSAVPTHVRAATMTVGAVGGVAAAAGLIGLVAPPGRPARLDVLRAVVVGVGLSLFGVGAITLIDAAIPALGPLFEERNRAFERILRPNEPAFIPVVFLVIAVAPGICEEWLFRGVLWRAMQRASVGGRLLVTSILFSLAHLDPISAGPLLVVGCAMGWLREQTGTWSVPAVAHIALNAFSGVVVVRITAFEHAGVPAAVALVVLGLVVAGVTLHSGRASRSA